MDDLTAFLAARLDEDEARARRGSPDAWLLGSRTLREVEAKRDILRRHGPAGDPVSCLWCSEDYRPYPWPCPDVRSIAAVWSDHPDYRPEWKP